MKFLSFVLAMSLTASAFAGVKEDVQALGQLAFGSNEYKVKGKTAEEMFKNYLQDDEELVNKEARTWNGLTKLKRVSLLLSQRSKWEVLLKAFMKNKWKALKAKTLRN